MTFSDLIITIDQARGTYKSFETEGYPLKGVTYPVDYGSIAGYRGEDGDDLDVFIGTGDKFGMMKVWRLDVPVETKMFAKVSDVDIDVILKEFAPVVLEHHVFSENEFLNTIEKFHVTK